MISIILGVLIGGFFLWNLVKIIRKLKKGQCPGGCGGDCNCCDVKKQK